MKYLFILIAFFFINVSRAQYANLGAQGDLVHQNWLVHANFESGNLLGANAFKNLAPQSPPPQGPAETRWVITNSTSRGGNYSCKISCADGNTTVGSTKPTERAELLQNLDSLGNMMIDSIYDKDFYYAFSVKFNTDWIDPKYVVDGQSYHGIFFQLHQIGMTNYAPGPLFALQATDKLWATGSAGYMVTKGGPLKRYTWNFADNDLNLGYWNDFIIKIRYSRNETGHITVYRRKQQSGGFVKLMDTACINALWVGTTDPAGSGLDSTTSIWYVQHYGYYRAAQTIPVTNTLWYDNITRGTDSAQVVNFAFNSLTVRADAGTNQKIRYPGTSSVTLDGTKSQGNNLTHTWSVVTKPAGASNPTFNDTHSATPTVSGLTTLGVYTFQDSVTDGTATSTATVSVVVNECCGS